MSEERQGALKIFDAIIKINPDARVVIRGGDIDTCEIEWQINLKNLNQHKNN